MFSYFKYFNFNNPNLKIERNGNEITVYAGVPDKAVVTYTNQEAENRNVLHLLSKCKYQK